MKKCKKSIYLWSFLVPLFLLLFVMYQLKLYPFGDKNFLLWDMDIQYKNIYGWFYDVLHGNANLFYDFSKSLGGDMYSIFAGYLASPINLLVYFFPSERIIYFILIATLLKISLCGLTCCIYLKKRWKMETAWMLLLFSTSYALMEYNVSLCSNLHFLDGIYMLPIVALGIYQLVEEKRGWILWLAVSYSIFTNWYIGYMNCLFSVFYFIFEWMIQKKEKKIEGDEKDKFIVFKLYIWYMILGVMGGSITFLPSILASVNGKGSLDFSVLSAGFHNNILTPLKGLSIISLGNTSYDEPAIYVSGLLYVLVVMYFFNRYIAIREKIGSLFMLLFVYLSFSFVPLEVLWTMLKKTYSFHFRYAFIFSFLLIITGARCWSALEKEKNCFTRNHMISIFSIVGLYGIVSITPMNQYRIRIKILFAVLLFGFACLVYCYHKVGSVWKKNVILSLLVFCCFIELGYNTNIAFRRYNNTNQSHMDYVKTINKVVEQIAEEDTDFYRLEKTVSSLTTEKNRFPAAATEALLFNYNGITHYSSFYDGKVNRFLAAMGYCKPDANWTNYCDANIVIDSLLGIKYVITDKEPAYMERIETEELPFQHYLYKNPYALSFGTIVESDIGNLEYSQNPFENQELILEAMTGQRQEVYKKQEVEERKASEWEITIKDDGAAYAYFSSGHSEVSFYVNGEYRQPYYSRAYKNIVYLGAYHTGETIHLSFDEKDCKVSHNLNVVTVEKEKLISVMNRLQEDAFCPEIIKDNYIEGIYNSKEEGVMLLSVPYSKGWKLLINGKETEYGEALNCMIRIPFVAGENKIQLRYTPPFLKISIILFCLGIVFFIWTEMTRCKNSYGKKYSIDLENRRKVKRNK